MIAFCCHVHNMIVLKLKMIIKKKKKITHCLSSFRKAQEGKKKVVLAGCVPQAQPRQEYLKGLSIIGVCIFRHQRFS